MINVVYSTVDTVAIRTTAAAVTTPSAHSGLKRPSALDNDRFEGADVVAVIFRSNCVGSMVGVIDIWNIGARGEPSNWYKLR